MQLLFRLALLFGTMLLTLAGYAAPALPKGVAKITSVEGITQYRLANGLEVLIAPDPSKPQIVVNITYKVGSRHESYGESGMAHLLEHMLFKGSRKHPKITDEFTKRGAQWNASTWSDRTNYYEVFTASDEQLDWALSLEADRMVNSFIRKADLDTEMPVVRSEFEIGENDPTSILTERVISTMYLWHNYGKSTIGARSDIENVSVPRLQAFYAKHYQPDNAVLTIAGRIDEANTLAMVARHFGAIAKPRRVLQILHTQEPVQDGGRSVTLERNGDVQVIAAGHHVPPMAHADYAMTVLISEVLTNAPSGRLHKLLVETKKATNVASQNFENRDPTVSLVWAELRMEQDLDEARRILLGGLDGFAVSPVTTDELQRAKSKLLNDIDLTINSSVNLAVRLSEAVGAGDWRLFFLHRDRIRNATAAEVQRAALAYLKPANRTVGTFVPVLKADRAEIPKVDDVSAVVKGYVGDPPIAIGEAFDASPDNIEKRVKQGQLPGGMKTAFLAKKTRGETVHAQIALRFGDEANLIGQRAAGDMVGGMLMRGTTTKTREQLRDQIDALKADVSISSDPTGAYVNISAKRQTFPAVLKLVADMLRNSSFPANEYAQLKQEQLAELERALSDPGARASEALDLHFNVFPENDVRRALTLNEAIRLTKATSLDEVKVFHRTFYGADHALTAVVGDFDEYATGKLLQELIDGWASQKPFKQLESTYQAMAPASLLIETPDKESATFLARINLNLGDGDPDYAAMKLADWMLGGGADFAARMVARIRVKEGLSYAVKSSLEVNPFDHAGSWLLYVQFAPQNRARVEAAFRDELSVLAINGFSTMEIANAKSGYMQSRQLARSNDAGLAQKLAQDLYLNRTSAWDKALEQRIQTLTAAEIQAAFRKYLVPAGFTIVNAGDFGKPVSK
ncbi:MAG: pitrilysin family protein [Betaproteobacteria bacterium]